MADTYEFVARDASGTQQRGTLAGSSSAVSGSISALTISNSLNLSGTAFMALDPVAGTNDSVRGLTTVTYGGTLSLTNLSLPFNTNNAFKLFSAAGYAGGFTNVVPAIPAPGFAWKTNTLITDGTLRILQTVSTAPVSLTNDFSGSTLKLSWPADHIGWRLQTQTNTLDVGLGANWTDIPGSTDTNQMSFPIDPAGGSVFYRMVFP